MAHPVNSIIELLTTTQCPLVIDGTSFSADSLVKIAEAAKSVGCQVRITNRDRFDVESLSKDT
jgi:hypothetical protein